MRWAQVLLSWFGMECRDSERAAERHRIPRANREVEDGALKSLSVTDDPGKPFSQGELDFDLVTKPRSALEWPRRRPAGPAGCQGTPVCPFPTPRLTKPANLL